MKDCVFLADKGYLKHQLDLFTYSNIKIEVPMRKINEITRNNLMCLESLEKELKLYSLNYVTSL